LVLLVNIPFWSPLCCSKVIMSGVNGNVIMSGYGDEKPDDEGRETARDYTKSVSSRVNDGADKEHFVFLALNSKNRILGAGRYYSFSDRGFCDSGK